MKVRDSGMPEEEMWGAFFDAPGILDRLGCQNPHADVVEFGCGYGTFTPAAAARTSGTVGVIHWNYDPTTPRGPDMRIRPRPEQCRQWVEAAGFELVLPHVDLPPYHYGLVGRKMLRGT